MTTWLRLLIPCMLLACFASCGGGSGEGRTNGDGAGSGPDGGGSGSSDPPVVGTTALNVLTAAERVSYEADLLSDFAIVTDASTGGGQTVFGSQPTTGSVSYDGYMQLIMGNASVSANVIGNAMLQLDIANATLSGTASGFQGITEDEFDFPQVAHYDGVVTITDATVGASPDGHYAVGFGINGVLDNGLNSFAIDGNLIGSLYGAEAEGLYAIGSYTNIHGSMDITIDGVDTPEDIGIATVSTLKQ